MASEKNHIQTYEAFYIFLKQTHYQNLDIFKLFFAFTFHVYRGHHGRLTYTYVCAQHCSPL